MNPTAYFSALARYDVWATQRLLNAVAPVSDDDYRRDVGLFFKSIHGTFNHLLVGEHHLWYPRFAEGVSPRRALDEEAESDRAALAQALQSGVARWQPLIESWPAERFDGALDYITSTGLAVSLPFVGTLAHVFNHGTHHRGQVTAALTRLGQPCPVIDLVYMLMEEQSTS